MRVLGLGWYGILALAGLVVFFVRLGLVWVRAKLSGFWVELGHGRFGFLNLDREG